MTVPANRSGLFGSRMRWTYVVARRAAQPKGRAELWAGGVQLILPQLSLILPGRLGVKQLGAI